MKTIANKALDNALLDTDILSEVLKGINPQVLIRANAYLEAYDCYTLSVITVMEIVRGWHRLQQNDRIQRFLSTLPTAEVLAVDTPIPYDCPYSIKKKLSPATTRSGASFPHFPHPTPHTPLSDFFTQPPPMMYNMGSACSGELTSPQFA